jgi:hypothetical protein
MQDGDVGDHVPPLLEPVSIIPLVPDELGRSRIALREEGVARRLVRDDELETGPARVAPPYADGPVRREGSRNADCSFPRSQTHRFALSECALRSDTTDVRHRQRARSREGAPPRVGDTERDILGDNVPFKPPFLAGRGGPR